MKPTHGLFWCAFLLFSLHTLLFVQCQKANLAAIEGLQPWRVWKYFYEISQVPRPSHHYVDAVQYLKEFATQNNFTVKVDAKNNVLITVPANANFANGKEIPSICLQSHYDIVPDKIAGSSHNFKRDSLVILREGDYIRANGTTLGADNGIGVAMMMAVATDPLVQRGPLELLFTSDEEVGLDGANALESSFFDSKYLINTDAGSNEEFLVGCAGGVITKGVFFIPLGYAVEGENFKVSISGLKGGHSGMMIHEGRANAIKVAARYLKLLQEKEIPFYLHSIDGGSAMNAIPNTCDLVITSSKEELQKVAKIMEERIKQEFGTVDPDIKFTVTDTVIHKDTLAFDEPMLNKLINTLLALPHGALSYNARIPSLVDTSSNLAKIETVWKPKGSVTITTSQRSSFDSARDAASASVASIFELAEAFSVNAVGKYAGWNPDFDSPLLGIATKVFKQATGKEPKLNVIHAGVEPGVLIDKKKGDLQAISMGVNYDQIHTTEERLSIHAPAAGYEILRGILTEFAYTHLQKEGKSQ